MSSAQKQSFDPTVWVDEHGNYLFAYACSRIRTESIAEDLLQETLISAIKAFSDYPGKSLERDWLTSILKNKIIEYFRTAYQGNQPTSKETDLSPYQYLFDDKVWSDHWTPELMPQEWKATPEEVLEKDGFCLILEHCLKELPERVAGAYTLHEMDGLPSEEICEIFGISTDNYWLFLHRARTHLRRCLEFDWFRKGEIH